MDLPPVGSPSVPNQNSYTSLDLKEIDEIFNELNDDLLNQDIPPDLLKEILDSIPETPAASPTLPKPAEIRTEDSSLTPIYAAAIQSNPLCKEKNESEMDCVIIDQVQGNPISKKRPGESVRGLKVHEAKLVRSKRSVPHTLHFTLKAKGKKANPSVVFDTGRERVRREWKGFSYEGDTDSHHLPHGRGTLYRPDKTRKVTGNFNHGTLEGFGTSYHNDGITIAYEGMFANDLPNGQGRVHLESGSLFYEGSFLNGALTGKGKLYDALSRLRYEGEILNGIFHGDGILYCDETSFLEAKFHQGFANGIGRHVYYKVLDKALRVETHIGPYIQGIRQGLFDVFIDDVLCQKRNYCDGVLIRLYV
jgi:hypothetical protein